MPARVRAAVLVGLVACTAAPPPVAEPEPGERVWHLVHTPTAARLSELVAFGSALGPLDERPGTRIVVGLGSDARPTRTDCAPWAIHMLRADAAMRRVGGEAPASESVAPAFAGVAQLAQTEYGWRYCFPSEFYDPDDIVRERLGLKRGATCWEGNPADQAYCQALVEELGGVVSADPLTWQGQRPELYEAPARYTEEVWWRPTHPPMLVARLSNPAGAVEATFSLPEGGFNVKLGEYAKHLVVACAYAAQTTTDPDTRMAQDAAYMRVAVALRVALPGLAYPQPIAFEGGEPSGLALLGWAAESMGMASCADVTTLAERPGSAAP